MGLLAKAKGKSTRKFSFALHVHTLTLTSGGGSLCVTFERGSHSGSTRPVAGLRGSYAFEEQLQLPATLYQDAGGSRDGRGTSSGYLAKELKLAVVSADKRGKPTGAALATATLNLADFAGEAAPITQTLALSPGGRLLLTVGCHEAGQGGEGALALQRWMSGVEAAAREGLPTSMSTDEEGGSRPSSAGAYSRPGSAAEGTVAGAYERQLSTAALGAIPEEASATVPAARGRSPQRQQHAGVAPAAAAVAAAAAPQQQQQQVAAAPPPAAPEVSARFDEDGFLLDGSVDVEASQEVSGSVRRDLGSALERAEASEGSAPAEVQSRPGGGTAAGTAAGAPAGQGAFALARARRAPVPATPAGAVAVETAGSEPLSTGQESTFSAAGDPAVPFSVPPSTSRRFAQREGGGGRRWAWRREGGSGGAAAGAPTAFQRARLASASREGAGEGVPGPEQSGHSVASSAGVTSSAEASLSLRPLSSPDEAAGLHSAVASPSAASATAAAGFSAFQPAAQLFSGGSTDAPSLAAAVAAAQRQRGASGGGPLRPTISLLPGDSALPSPADGALWGASSQLVEALLQELRGLAALESAVYLAGGRKAFSGGRRELHTPARRLARTIISLEGPQEGLAFGLQAVRAIRATCGAASGDLHRLTFWWSNVLQLRWSFWELCRGQGLGAAAAGASLPPRRNGSRQEGLEVQGSGTVSPRAALAAAAAARSAAASGLEWMLVLLPQLQDLEGWLFAQMLRHLWWRVLLQGVAQQPGGGDAAAGGGGSSSARSARTGAPLTKAVSATSDQFSPGTQQGTPRSFETPEEEAVHRWVCGLRGVERALKDSSRPAPAPRAHLALLHRQLITALLRRLDTLLFRKLLADEGDSPRHPLRLPSMSGRDVVARSAAAGAEAEEALGLMGADAAAVVALEQGVLPFQRGALTFGTGVALKMAVSRLTQWAADCGVKEEKLPQAARSTDMSDYRLFPHLRATADLLMMPKEVLTDREMRREVVPGLPLRRICQLLERWEPDESAPDPLPPGLMEALQSESPRSEGSTPSPTSRQEEEYLAPDEEALLAEGVIEPLSLELGEESEDELESLAAGTGEGFEGGPELSPGGSAAPGDEARASRFALLRALWGNAR